MKFEFNNRKKTAVALVAAAAGGALAPSTCAGVVRPACERACAYLCAELSDGNFPSVDASFAGQCAESKFGPSQQDLSPQPEVKENEDE